MKPIHLDPLRFSVCCEAVVGQAQGFKGIGTLKEKTVHAVLKHYYCPDSDYHEQRIGAFVADIFQDGHIIEIQTRNFNTMRKKLDAFLPLHEVTIVYPVAYNKWLSWVDPETGEISSKRKSPKTGTIYNIIPELYRIKNYLTHPNLHFIIPLINIEEYRLLDGWSKDKKKGSTRMDGIPVALIDEIHLHTLSDYQLLLPEGLPTPFTTKDYKKATKLTQVKATTGINILYFLGQVERVGKKGNAYLYEKKSL